MFVWEWQRLFGVAVAFVLVAVAITVFVFRPSGRANRRLAALLIGQGVALGAGWCLAYMTVDEHVAHALVIVAWAATAAVVPLYLLLLATLSTPLVRPLASRPATAGLWALVGAGVILAAVRPDLFFEGLVHRNDGPTFVQVAVPPFGVLLPVLHALVLPLVGLACALDQWRRMPRQSLLRRRASAYALAFCWRDISWAFFLIGLPALLGTVVTESDPLTTVLFAVSELVFMSFLVYGVLSAQLFDIDIKARLVIGQSTFAAIVAGVFFILAELAEQLVEANDLMAALLTAAIITLAFRPLQIMSTRLAKRIIPERGPQQEVEQKLEFYEAAVQSLLVDGTISDREADVLSRMRAKLDLREEDVAHLHGAAMPDAQR